MTTTPPPPGGGDNQPYNPSGSNPYPSSGSGSTPSGAPSYGSAPGGGMPPQAPPPAPGSYPSQGGGSKNGQIMSIIAIVTGVIGLCCSTWFIFSIAAVVLGFLGGKEYDKAGQKKTLALVGLGLGIAGIVIGIIWWILIATGAIDSGISFNSNM